MISTDLIKKIRRIEMRTRRLVNDSFAGEYHSIFKGMGMEFHEVRPYQPGDEVRSIDWNVTARMGQLFVKRYVEERELTVMLLVDASASHQFGSRHRFKRDLAAEMGAVLAFSATSNNDRVGLLVFTDKVELFIPPRKGRRHVLRIIRDLLAFEPSSKGTDIGLALHTVYRLLKRRAIVFVISDFISDPQTYHRPLHIASRRHDVIAVDLHDPLETSLPAVGLLALEDAETGELLWVDSSDPGWRQSLGTGIAQSAAARQAIFYASGVDHIKIQTGEDYVKALTDFFQTRARRLHR